MTAGQSSQYGHATTTAFCGGIHLMVQWPDEEISSYVSDLARRIESFPAAALASIKAIVSRMTSIDTGTFAEESARFRAQMASAETAQRIEWGLKQGFNTASEFELNLGRLLATYRPA